MKRDPVTLVWVGGLALAAVLYAVGTDQLLFRLFDAFHHAGWWVREFIASLSLLAVDLVRALALGLYATFIALGILAARRGQPARGALLGVSVLFWLLAAGNMGPYGSSVAWAGALLVAGFGAAIMTQRLRRPQVMAAPPGHPLGGGRR